MKTNRTIIKVHKIKYLISLFLTIVLFYNCNSQKNKYIDTKFDYKQEYDSNREYFKSKELDRLFNLNNKKYFIPDIYGLNTDTYYIKPISIKDDHEKSYILLYDKNDILRDTLSISNEYSYSINVRLENNKKGICLGRFKEENTFFEIEKIYEVSNKIKLKPISIETRILYCPVPVEYISEENVGIEDYFKYGKNNNIAKKYIIPFEWYGVYSKTIETDMTITGMESITYNFAITKDKILLKINTYHEPISCDGEYYAIENSNILELYYNENDALCKSEAPNFMIKKQNGKYYIKGLGGGETINEWIEVKKEK